MMFSQEGAPQTHQPVFDNSRNAGIGRSSVGRIIRDLFRATHLQVADVFSNSAAIQLK